MIDYKTDRLGDSAPADHAADYSLQRDLYALAVSRATETDRVRVAYVFLENPTEPVVEELDGAAIEAARLRLEAAIAEISAGEFEVTASPTWELCRDCPARQRLCPSPAAPPS